MEKINKKPKIHIYYRHKNDPLNIYVDALNAGRTDVKRMYKDIDRRDIHTLSDI